MGIGDGGVRKGHIEWVGFLDQKIERARASESPVVNPPRQTSLVFICNFFLEYPPVM